MIIETFIEKIIENFTHNWFYIYWILVIIMIIVFGFSKIGKRSSVYNSFILKITLYIVLFLLLILVIDAYTFIIDSDSSLVPIVKTIGKWGLLFIGLFPLYMAGIIGGYSKEHCQLLASISASVLLVGGVCMLTNSSKAMKSMKRDISRLRTFYHGYIIYPSIITDINCFYSKEHSEYVISTVSDDGIDTVMIETKFKGNKDQMKYNILYNPEVFSNLKLFIGDTVLWMRSYDEEIYHDVYSFRPTPTEILKYRCPVLIKDGEEKNLKETTHVESADIADSHLSEYLKLFEKLHEPEFGNVCFNLVYKSVYDGSYLNFIDVLGNPQSVSYKTRNYSCSDTVLVFNNIKDTVAKRFVVCDKSVNTSDNWHKISDYGYIFHYDVYSKEEVENQCPKIREYVEKYKERNMKK